jgi:serine/threonine protein kinase
VSARTPARFDLQPGLLLAGKYRVEEFVGDGWEGEVYRVVERRTGVIRAAKLFYPERNPANRTLRRYARQLDRLRHCRIVIDYHHSEEVPLDGAVVTCLLSDFVPGTRLVDYTRPRGPRLELFEALHVLHTVAEGLECIHAAGLYHGDLHAENLVLRRAGVRLDLRLFDFFNRGRPSRAARQGDVLDAVRLFYDLRGGAASYAAQPEVVKRICRGLRHGLILEHFPDARRLRRWLEQFSWDSG